jgi:hypothetical protein
VIPAEVIQLQQITHPHNKLYQLRYRLTRTVGNRVQQVQSHDDTSPDACQAAMVVALTLKLRKLGQNAGQPCAVA